MMMEGSHLRNRRPRFRWPPSGLLGMYDELIAWNGASERWLSVRSGLEGV